MVGNPAGPVEVLRVVLVADRRLMGEAVRMALQSRGMQAIFLASPRTRGQLLGAMRRVVEFLPDVGVLMCELGDPTQVRRVRTLVNRTTPSWLLLTSATDARRWGSLVAAGVAAALPLNTSLDELHGSLSMLAAGQPLMTDEIRARVLVEWRAHDRELRRQRRLLQTLTPRERVVLESLSEGLTVRQITRLHGVSESTVRSQVKAILHKLEVRSQLAAVVAYRAGTE
jgi:DNA-binding NarL/FixJ family response regulator